MTKIADTVTVANTFTITGFEIVTGIFLLHFLVFIVKVFFLPEEPLHSCTTTVEGQLHNCATTAEGQL